MNGARRDRFEAIYRTHHGAVRAYLLRRAEPELAQDALSETFLAAWRRFDELLDHRGRPVRSRGPEQAEDTGYPGFTPFG